MTFLLIFRVVFVPLFFASTTLLPGQTPAPATNSAPVIPPEPADLVVLHDVVFGQGNGHDLHAEIAYPKNATGPLTAVIYIHGGGWVGGNQKQSPIFQIAHAGYFGASIEYRLDNVSKWPSQLEDCQLGVRWLRANAAQYHIDPDHIGVWGESAGGHLAACLGTMADVKEDGAGGGYPGVSSAVQAVVDYFGPTDFTNPDPSVYSPQALGLVRGLFGLPYGQNPNLWKSGSPLTFVKAGDPPVLLVHGDSDALVPLVQSTLFDAALTKVGVPHQFVIVKNAGHGFHPQPGTTIDPSNAEIRKLTFAFFDKYLKAPPTTSHAGN